MKDWLKRNATLVVLIGTLLSSVVTTFAVGFDLKFRKAEPGEKPGVIIVLPGDDAVEKEDVFLGSKVFGAGGEKRHPLFNFCGRIAGARYAAAHGLSRSEGRDLAWTIPYSQVVAQAKAQGLDLGTVPTEYTLGANGVYKGKIIDWIIANPEKVEMIIKILLMLIPLFADSGDVIPGIPFDDTRVCQVPYPLAWERPHLALAA